MAACAAALLLALVACGQKGPLYLPSQPGMVARPVARVPSAPADGRPATPAAPVDGASSPARPAAAK